MEADCAEYIEPSQARKEYNDEEAQFQHEGRDAEEQAQPPMARQPDRHFQIEQHELLKQIGLEGVSVGPKGVAGDLAVSRAKVGEAQREDD